MPWTCKECGVEVANDDSECPACDKVKTSWTLVQDQTLTLVVGKKQLSLARGAGTAPQRQHAAGELTLVDAKAIPVVTKGTAKALSDEGLLPATQDLLFVRLQHNGHKTLDVELEVIFEGQDAEDRTVAPAVAGKRPKVVDVPLLFVHGPGSLDGIDLPGVHLVDITEDEGFASDVAFSALGKSVPDLPTEASTTPPPATSVAAATTLQSYVEVLLHGPNQAPLAGVPLTLTVDGQPLAPVTTDAQGVARFEGILPGAKCVVSCQPGDAALWRHVGWSPAPFTHREGERRGSPSVASTMLELIGQIRRLELAYPDKTGERVAQELLLMGGCFGLNFRALLGRLDPIDWPAERTWSQAFGEPPEAAPFVVGLEDVRGAAGETFEAFATRVGVEPLQLARFNWGVETLEHADLCLGAVVGCQDTDDQGRALFRGDEDVGLLRPTTWEQPVELDTRTAVALASHARDAAASLLLLDSDLNALSEGMFHLSWNEEGNTSGVEKGVPEDPYGSWVSPSHMLLGVFGAEHRFKSFDGVAAFVDLLEPMAREQTKKVPRWAPSPFGVPLPYRWISEKVGEALKERYGDKLARKFPRVDNLYTNTLAGDLGQSVYQRSEDSSLDFIGKRSDATFGEMTGDIDGILICENLKTWYGSHFGGRGLTSTPTLRVSEILQRYYAREPARQLPINAGNRFASFANYVDADYLCAETLSFAVIYSINQDQRGDRAGLLGTLGRAEEKIKELHDRHRDAAREAVDACLLWVHADDASRRRRGDSMGTARGPTSG